jgi:N-acetylglucosamine-6-sulfatase
MATSRTSSPITPSTGSTLSPHEQPYFLYLSHKAVHADFIPAERHKGAYAKETFIPPKTMAESGPNAQHRPMWVQNQRNSWHGVNFPYHSDLNIGEYYKRYAERLLGVDESLGRVLDALRKRGQLDSTLIVYMGDNGFAFGEHGLIDKRTTYEESMRVPMLARCPEFFSGGRVVDQMVANLDIMPTVLDAGDVAIPQGLDGRSMLPLLRGQTDPHWRKQLLYEYYWERNFPQTLTMHALRTDRYKYIHYSGIWDSDELYDLQEDPLQTTNLIFNPERKATIQQMNSALFDEMQRTDGEPFSPPTVDNLRKTAAVLPTFEKSLAFVYLVMSPVTSIRTGPRGPTVFEFWLSPTGILWAVGMYLRSLIRKNACGRGDGE